MKATYRISEQDYVNAMKLFARLRPRLVILCLVGALVLVVLATFGSPALRGGAIGGLIGGFSVALVGRYHFATLAWRHYRKYKAIHEEFTIELIDDGVRFTSPNGDGKITWDKVYKWRQNEDLVLIYPMPRMFHMIPKIRSNPGIWSSSANGWTATVCR